MLVETFGTRLKKWREWRGLTQKQLGDQIGIGVTHVDRLEHGTRLPTLRMVERLLDALNVDIATFFEEDA